VVTGANNTAADHVPVVNGTSLGADEATSTADESATIPVPADTATDRVPSENGNSLGTDEATPTANESVTSLPAENNVASRGIDGATTESLLSSKFFYGKKRCATKRNHPQENVRKSDLKRERKVPVRYQ